MKQFASVVPLANGRFAVESGGKGPMAARWGDYATAEEAQEKADRLNRVTEL